MQFFKNPRLKLLITVMLSLFTIFLTYFFIMNNFFYKYASFKSARMDALKEYYQEIPLGNIDTLVLGDSVGLYGIDPKYFGSNSFSYCMLGATNYFNYKILSEFIVGRNIKKIILTQSFINAHYDEDIWGFFVPKEIFSLSDVLRLLCPNSKCRKSEKISIIAFYWFSRYYISPQSISLMHEYLENINIDFFNLKKYYKDVLVQNNGFFKKNKTLWPNKNLFNKSSYNFNFSPEDLNNSDVYYLKELVSLATKNQIKIYFVVMPYARKLMGVNMTKYDRGLLEVLKKFETKGFQILDMRELENELKLENFWDFTHLNDSGAQILSKHLKNQIEPRDSVFQFENVKQIDSF